MFDLITDSCWDLPPAFATELDVTVVPLTLELDGAVLDDGIDLTPKALFDLMRTGKTPKTSAVNPDRWGKAMEVSLTQGRDVLVIAFSSGLSTTYQSAVIAAQELQQQYPQRTIRVVDSLCASPGQGLLVWYAAQRRKAGWDLDTLYHWVMENRLTIRHWVAIDDLMHLKRGGRIGAATAALGTMLSMKPMLKMDDHGRLETTDKVRGRKAALNALVKRTLEAQQGQSVELMLIGHGDCPEDAQYLAEKFREAGIAQRIELVYIGAVIGAHTGPGVIAVFAKSPTAGR